MRFIKRSITRVYKIWIRKLVEVVYVAKFLALSMAPSINSINVIVTDARKKRALLLLH
jgi:hypothetical protein